MDVDEDAPVLQCPWHGWEFELGNGRALWDASYAVRVYPVHVRDGRVLVEVGRKDPA
jgi:nitrite reductase/ring-hydroxylating ferredoxin subunit